MGDKLLLTTYSYDFEFKVRFFFKCAQILTFDTKSRQIYKKFHGLTYSPFNSATLSCSSEVTLMCSVVSIRLKTSAILLVPPASAQSVIELNALYLTLCSFCIKVCSSIELML